MNHMCKIDVKMGVMFFALLAAYKLISIKMPRNATVVLSIYYVPQLRISVAW